MGSNFAKHHQQQEKCRRLAQYTPSHQQHQWDPHRMSIHHFHTVYHSPPSPGSLLISCSPTEPHPSLHHVFGMTCHLNSAFILPPPSSLPIINNHLLPPPQSIALRLSIQILKCCLFKNSYPDSSDHPSPILLLNDTHPEQLHLSL